MRKTEPKNRNYYIILLVVVLLTCLAGLGAIFAIPVLELRETQLTYVAEPNRYAKVTRAEINQFFQATLDYYERQLLGPADDMQRMRLDIKHKHLQKLLAKREEALKVGVLFSEDEDMVPARMTADGKEFDVKMRLKGDLTDHLSTNRWSFRIKVKNGDSVYGMKKFSIQPPHTRQFQNSAIFADDLREQGILAPRFSLVDLAINGTPIGVMLLEEHFTDELIQSQQRRSSVILKYNEDYFWQAWVDIAPIAPDFDNWRNMPLTAFGLNKVLKSPVLRPLLGDAIGMLKGVMADQLTPSDVFDAEQWGQFLAACEIWGANHMVYSHQLRMYFNPVTYKLEPIVFDGNIVAPPPEEQMVCQGREYAMMTALVEDPVIRLSMLKHLKLMTASILSGDFAKWVDRKDQEYGRYLRQDYPALQAFPLNELQARARWLQSVDEESLADFVPELRSYADFDQPYGDSLNYPAVVYAYVETVGNQQQLTLVNALGRQVEIISLDAAAMDKDAASLFPLPEGTQMPILLAPSRRNELPGRVAISLPFDASIRWPIRGLARVEGEQKIYSFEAIKGYAALNELPARARAPLNNFPGVIQGFSN
jgi:hypothetical protein